MKQPSFRLHRSVRLLLLVVPALCVSCAETSNNSLYDKVFEKSRQRRIEKDMANLKAGRPLQYYHSSRDLYDAQRTGRD